MSTTHPLLVLALLLLHPGALAAQLGPIGLSTDGAQWFANGDPPSPSDTNDWFGNALATGDFNGDGADDLATAAPQDTSDGVRSGTVVVRYGRRGNWLGPVTTVLGQESVSTGMSFGSALAAGDFDGDSFDDLAVGIVDDTVTRRGAVRVYYGASDGLSGARYEALDEHTVGGAEHVCNLNFFGYALTSGRFDGDPYEDLAIGVPAGCEWVPGLQQHVRGGSLYVVHGSAEGLLPFTGYRISQDSYGMYDEVESGDQFGVALAAGDFNADGYDDLGVGVASENQYSGAIAIVMGSQFGLIFANSAFWLPGALGEDAELGDQLGLALAAGDFDGDGFDDLAIGTPLEDLGPTNGSTDSGAVDIAYGAADPHWFDLSRTDHLTQSAIYSNAAHDGRDDRFGSSFAVGDFDRDGRDDLAIGHPRDDWSGPDLGAVTILMGGLPPLGSSSRHHLLAIGWEGVPGNASEADQGSGSALASGNFDGAGGADLAIGVPYTDNGPTQNTGAEAVLYSETKLFGDGFETGNTGRWSANLPN